MSWFLKDVQHLNSYAEVEKESSPKRNSINKEIRISDMLMWQCYPQPVRKGD